MLHNVHDNRSKCFTILKLLLIVVHERVVTPEIR